MILHFVGLILVAFITTFSKKNPTENALGGEILSSAQHFFIELIKDVIYFLNIVYSFSNKVLNNYISLCTMG